MCLTKWPASANFIAWSYFLTVEYLVCPWQFADSVDDNFHVDKKKVYLIEAVFEFKFNNWSFFDTPVT